AGAAVWEILNAEFGMRSAGYEGKVEFLAANELSQHLRIPHSTFRTLTHGTAAARPGTRRPNGSGEDGRRRRDRQASSGHGDLRRCAPGVSPPRHRHGKAPARAAGPRA